MHDNRGSPSLTAPNDPRTGEPRSAIVTYWGSVRVRTNSNTLTFSFVHHSFCSGPYTMPPQPGVFPLPYASTHKARANPTEIHNGTTDVSTSYLPPPHHTIHHTSSTLLAGPSSRPHGTFVLRSHECIQLRSFITFQAPTLMTGSGTEGGRRL